MATETKRRSYRGDAYWERETPREAWTEKAALAYYPEAGKLQVALTYPDKESGGRKRGKVVTLDAEDVQLHPEALDLLRDVVDEWSA